MNSSTKHGTATTLFACKKYEDMKSSPPSKTVRKCKTELSPEFDVVMYTHKSVEVCKDVEVIDNDAVIKAKNDCEMEELLSHRP